MTLATSDNRSQVLSELRLTFSVVAIVVNGWAILTLLWAVPSFVSRLTGSESVGVASYVLAVALIETILLCVPVALIGVALAFLERHVHLALYVPGAILGISLWIMPCDPNGLWAATCHPQRWMLVMVLFLSWIGLVGLVLRRVPRWNDRLYAGLDRLVTLAVFYLLLDLAAVLVMASRLMGLAGQG